MLSTRQSHEQYYDLLMSMLKYQHHVSLLLICEYLYRRTLKNGDSIKMINSCSIPVNISMQIRKKRKN
jgi:hypothetical protein